MPKLTEKEKEEIVVLKNKGLSSRQIAKEIFGDKDKRKTTITDFLSSNRVSITSEDSFELKKPKIAFLDIETAYAIGAYWGKRYEVNFSQDQVFSESFILTYSVKYLGNDNIIYGALNHEEVKAEDDSKLCAELYQILNDVDVVVAHNGKAFDIPMINNRLLINGFKPPMPYKVIDTLLIARKYFKFPSNKLGDLCVYLGIGEKEETGGFILWREYMEGSDEAREKMINYNVRDTEILEKLYLKIRAWDSYHVNLSVYIDSDVAVCPCCLSKNLFPLDKIAYTSVSAYNTYRCSECGKVVKSRKNVLKNKVKLVNCN